MLLGREDERARIDRMLAQARRGVGGALVVRGEPGIGKSALLEYARSHADGLPTVSMHDPASPSVLSSAVFGLLSTGGNTQPLLVLIDDAHRLDARASAEIGLAAQYLRDEAIALLCAAQDGGGACPLLGGAGIEELRLTGLDRESVRELLVWLWSREPDPAVLEQLHEETGGNPLALRELVGLLRKTQIAGQEPLASPLAVGARVAHAFLQPVRDLPDWTQTALLVVAAAGLETKATLAAALHLLGRDQPDPCQLERLALEPAEDAGIIERDDQWVRFRHPIVRSAVYHRAPTDARRAAHLALARALTLLPGPQAADRRAWHDAAAAASSPCAPTGAAVEAAALQAYSRQRYAVAAQGLEWAANLTAEADRRAGCLLRAARGWHLLGRSQQADGLLGQALADVADARLRADIVRLRGQLWTWTGQPAAAHRLLAGQAARIEALDARRSALMLVDAGLAALLAGDGERAGWAAGQAERLAVPAGAAAARAVSGCVSAVRVACGDAAGASSLMGPLAVALSGDGACSLDGQWVGLAASALIWLERYDVAEQALGQVVEQARAGNAPALLPVPLALLAEAAFRTGRWDDARGLAAEAAEVGERVGQPDGQALGLGCLARLDAVRGLELRSRSRAAAAAERASGSVWLRPQAAAALGLLALGLGEAHEAVRHLEACAAMLAQQGLRDPAVVQWAPDLIEAYVRVGRLADARRLLDRFEAQAERTERTWALAATARCRGLLASEADFEYHFAAAFRWHGRTNTPFEWARTALCLGARLRRAGRRPEARVHLRAALGALERLGATPWAQRARAELRMAGDQADVASWVERRLTRKEAEVAWLVAQGRTNREAAHALGVTPRTVAFHLGNIYRKLDICSRADLTAAGPTRMLAG